MSPLGGEFEEEVSADRSPEHIFFRVKGSHLQTIELNRRLAKYMRLFVLRKSADAVDKRVEEPAPTETSPEEKPTDENEPATTAATGE